MHGLRAGQEGPTGPLLGRSHRSRAGRLGLAGHRQQAKLNQLLGYQGGVTPPYLPLKPLCRKDRRRVIEGNTLPREIEETERAAIQLDRVAGA